MTATAITEISSAAWRPTIEPPSTTPVAGSLMSFTKPRGSLLINALAEAENGTFVVRTLRPAANASASAEPDVGDLGLGEDGGGRLVVVEVPVLAGVQSHHVLGHLAALHRRHRRQRQLPRDVAGGVDVAHVRDAVLVDRDVAAAVDLDAGLLEAEAVAVGDAPDAEQHVRAGDGPPVVAADDDPAAVLEVGAVGTRPHQEPDAPTEELLLEGGRHLGVLGRQDLLAADDEASPCSRTS